MSLYTPAERKNQWVKLKNDFQQADFLIIGYEWGRGSRKNLFASFKLGCRNKGSIQQIGEVGSGFTMLQLQQLTNLLSEGQQVVLKIKYQGIQKSSKYNSGHSLRFPIFIQIRDDKFIDEIDTLEDLIN